MKHERRFRDDDWYDYREERKRDRKKARKARRGNADFWDQDPYSPEPDYEPAPNPRAQTQQPQPQIAAGDKPAPKPFRYNEESTVEIKGFKVDLSRVESVDPQDGEYKGRPSYGIRFAFMGGKGLGRTFWYGSNKKQRDEELTLYKAKRDEAVAKAEAARSAQRGRGRF